MKSTLYKPRTGVKPATPQSQYVTDAEVFETVIRRTVNEIISALPSLPDAVREQCRAANTTAECKAAAAAADAYAILILVCDIWCEATQEN